MIHEFAIDPSILNNWKDFRYFWDQCGVSQARMISDFPRSWGLMVYQACEESADRKLKEIEVLLTRGIGKKLIRLRRPFDESKNWLENAYAQHNVQPFKAVVAAENPRHLPYVLVADDVHNNVPFWNVPNQIWVKRKAADMAQRLALFLKASSEFVFIDPYFNPTDPDFCCSLEHFLIQLSSCRYIKRIEYHTSDRRCLKNDFERNCRIRLPRIIPRGVEVRFVQWKQRHPGKDIHDRFILTDIGGIGFGAGLSTAGKKKVVLLTLLNENRHKEILSDYDFGKREDANSAYEFVNDVVITGSKT